VPHLPYSIELHDSRLEAVVVDGVAVVQLRPAYIHGDGKGWTQDADLCIGHPEVQIEGAVLPAKLADGRMKTEQGPHHNLFELPLKESGPVTLTLELFSEALIRISGTGVVVNLYGEAMFVENVA
jgi:hypothetical protein